MNELGITFAKMMDILHELALSLTQEQDLLSEGQVNAALLHRVTENKNEQLATLQYLDHQRESLEKLSGVSRPPYDDNPALKQQWQTIMDMTEQLKQHNYRNGLLLAQHLVLNQQMLSLLEQHQTQRRLYGPDGQACTGQILGRKISV
ncbi:flagellar export chaperone FlgN [Acerihabitans sp. TG2]|uniref:flagella synthesis protein FlgN n=1 Tax=Acerihabitans sp. TG2 TaxID=3096008 RepID=UPI002B231382|nr:flagellar export chaperone FlgN [Acerihabitans sp. TG2]MEA9392610.1 flagellar export chaperone FlgN [Acerihabitans sp. TG2]